MAYYVHYYYLVKQSDMHSCKFKSLTLRQPLRAQKRLFKAVSELSLLRRSIRVLYRVLYRARFLAYMENGQPVSSSAATQFKAFSFAC